MPSLYPQGTFSFTGGIPPEAVLSFRVVQNHGITPAIFKVRMHMLPEPPDKNGDVTIQYGAFKRTFKDCTIDLVDRPDGAQLIWDVTILDRRWKWRFGKIDGAYNQRWKNGTELRDETKKTPSELVKLCLASLREQNVDVSALKEFDQLDWPETTWGNENPANAAQEICERYGCRLLCVFDQARIVKVGEGEGLDVSGLTYTILEDSETFDPPERPGRLVLRCGYTSVQADIPLFAVATELDGTIKPMDKVSYAPKQPDVPSGQTFDNKSGTYADAVVGYWNTVDTDLFHGIPQPHKRHLAEENIFRLYRIHPPINFTGLKWARGDSWNDPSLPDLEKFPDVSQNSATSWLWRLALQNEQNDRIDKYADPLNTQFDEYSREVSSSGMSPWVYGYYFNGGISNGNVPVDTTQLAPAAAGFITITKPGILKINPQAILSPIVKQTSTLPDPDSPSTVSYKVAESGFYTGGFSIIPEWGLVKFSEPVFQKLTPKDSGVTFKFADGTPASGGYSHFPPALWLRTRFFLRDPDTRGWIRAERVRVLDPNNPTTRYITRDDLIMKLTLRYQGTPNISAYPPTLTAGTVEDNWQVIKQAADAYLDQAELEYQTVDPHSVVYGGFVPYEIDGAIREVTWYVGEDGYAKTRVSRNTDYLVWHQDYSERRLAERVRARLTESAQHAFTPDEQAAMRAAGERLGVF